MWMLGHKESWALKNWCFRTVVLEKTLESLLDCKEIQPVNPKGNQPWIYIARTDAETEALILWPSDVKNWVIWKVSDAGKDWRWEEKYHYFLLFYVWIIFHCVNYIFFIHSSVSRLLCCFHVFTSGVQNIGVSVSASVLPMNIQDWFPLGWTDWISLQSKGLSRVFNTTVQKHQFFSTQLSL